MSPERTPLETDRHDLSRLRIEGDRRSRRRFPWLPLVLFVLVLASIGYVLRGTWLPLVEPLFLPTVEVAAVRRVAPGQAPTGALTANGYVVAQRQAALAPKQTGRLAELFVVEGSQVAAGDIVGRLEHIDLDAQLARAQADLREAEAELQRTETRVSQAAADLAEAQDQVAVSEAQEREAEASLEDAVREQGRQRELLAQGFASQSDFDRAETEVLRAKARLDQATAQLASVGKREQSLTLGLELAQGSSRSAAARGDARRADVDLFEAQLEYTIIRTPFPGVVISKNAEIGEIVAPISAGAQARVAVVTVVDMGSLMVEAEVGEAYIGTIRPDQPARIVLDAFPDAPYAGRVFKVVPTANRQKATVEVKVAFDDLDARILPEMGARVVFLEEELATLRETDNPRLYISAAALLGPEDDRFVWILSEGRVRRRAVVVGAIGEDEVEVVSGLSAGERVVTSTEDTLEEGQRVRVAKGPER